MVLKTIIMGCGITKCANPSCENRLQACQLINGYCPGCWERKQNGTLSKLVRKCLVSS